MFQTIQRLMDMLVSTCSSMGKLPFWDNSCFPWIPRLEKSWSVVRKEFDQVMLGYSLIPGLGDISEDANRGLDGKTLSRSSDWKWFFLFAYGHKIQEHCDRCPRTTELVEAIPGMRSAVFTVMSPRIHISPHRGLYKGLLRCHLGVRIPDPPDLCRISVGGETRTWEEGRMFVFDDTLTHEVWNDSDEKRVILILDVERPLSFPLRELNRLVLRWIYSTKYITDGVARLTIAKSEAARRQVSNRSASAGH